MFCKKPVIGIIPVFNLTNEENDPYKDQAKFVRMYSDLIKEVGGIPIGILTERLEDYLPLCDGYLWPGGNKILYEYVRVIEDAIKSKKPLLGICLGAQAISTYFNVCEDREKEQDKSFKETYDFYKERNPYLEKLKEKNIHSHIVTKEIESIEKAKHKIKIAKNSLLYEMMGKSEIEGVSLHEMSIARVPKNILVSGYAEDGVIEAIEYTKDNAKIIGLQWHPEIVRDTRPFAWLVAASKKGK